MMCAQPVPRWHAALAYALLGPPVRDLAEPGAPRIATLLTDLGGAAAVRHLVKAARDSGEWPYQVPPDLRRDLGAAQFAAAWTALLAALGPLTTNARPL